MGATGDLLFASIVVSDEESGPRGRDLLIAEPSTEKECPRRLVRTDYRASDPKTPVRIRARALQGETSVYDAESVCQFECNLSARCYAADPGCDFSRCNGQPRGRESSRHSTPLARTSARWSVRRGFASSREAFPASWRWDRKRGTGCSGSRG